MGERYDDDKWVDGKWDSEGLVMIMKWLRECDRGCVGRICYDDQMCESMSSINNHHQSSIIPINYHQS